MGCPEGLRPDMSVTDLAYCILKGRGKAVHFKELIQEIMRVKDLAQENPGRLIAQIHTEINLDSRFLHQGNGEWGLRDWLPKGGAKVVKIRPTTTGPSRPRPNLSPLDEEGFEEDEEEQERGEEELEETDEEYLDYGRDDTYGDDD